MIARRSACAALAVLAVVLPATSAAPAAADPVPVAQVRAGEWWLSKLGVQQAWSQTKGKGVTVAVVDTGVAASHPDLQGALAGGKDFSGDGNASGTKPINGDPHGTNMAGYIAGRGHGAGHALGMIGVAPEARLLSVSVSGIANGTAIRDPRPVAPGIRWAVDHGAKVINMSFGADVPAATIAYAQQHDVVLVSGSGNTGDEGLSQPGSYFGVVTVGGVDKNLATDPNASYGGPKLAGDPQTITAGGGVAVAGPYEDSATDASGMVSLSTTGYTRTAGTSNATAVVSGIVALIRAAHPDMDAANVVNQLIQTAKHVNPPGAGYDAKQGFGVPSAARAVSVTLPSTCENPLGAVGPPESVGAWRAVKENTRYTPKCTGNPSSSSPAPSSSGSSDASSGGSQPASSDSAVPPQASSSDSGGIPVWVWPVVAVVVIALVVALLLARRRPSRPTGPPPGYGPPPGGYGPPGHGPPR